MVVTHLFQILAFTAMEPPTALEPLAISREKNKVFRSMLPILPSNVVPGIDFTNDPLLQGRLFSYLDTQKSRLGTTNFHLIPVNAPKGPGPPRRNP